MLRLVTAAEMKDIDQKAMSTAISGEALMENAGRSVVDAVSRLPGPHPTNYLVVCGRGNNGGDGFVIARLLREQGASVQCLLLGRADELQGDALANCKRLAGVGLAIQELTSMDLLDSALASRPFVIDAIFGTGFAGVPRGLAAETIEAINRSGCRVVAVDIASGVNADDGNAPGPAVRAELTVTMALPKLGHLLFPGRACTGLLEVADIGIPPGMTAGGDTFLLDAAHVRSVLPERRPDGHKGTFGTALVVAGSRGFSGAACLAGMAAVRSGAGLVRLAFPAGIAPVVESRVIEAVKAHLPETTTGTLARAALAALRDLLPDADALAVGPGISTEPEAAEVARELITLSPVPVVIDADGLNNIAGRLALLGSARAPLVLTPHPGEFCRLSGVTPSEVNSNRIEVCRRFAAEHRVVLVLKGAPTVIGSPDGIVLVNPTGNSGLASGGTGDVLTGLLVGELAQGARPLDAAAAAAFLHGLAADIGVRTRTEYCLSASDLLDFLPAAFQSVLSA